ncbi:DNA-cytosine methyltransferase [Cellulosilyticum lentocellum DSM 5427]|uniref:Cytosine-specific methyltransferase n=2 Tax=Cellulosilyticum lentocellum TaxID=29360 RepID=F2JIR3_CELLD|nr:DNA-cytosine methyltransferase [Cellulosilyticum lentocellum DSM 5427]
MFNVVETFSGIGSQAKALRNIGFNANIVATADWDINAIIAYDLIHHGKQDLTAYNHYSEQQLNEELSKFTLSADGKSAMTEKAKKVLPIHLKKMLLYAIRRSNNLVSITDIKGKDISDNIDLLTYSFPCQDLSVCGFWHGNTSGIDRDANNRSGMLWEVERILEEMFKLGKKMPKFLLMENVSNILSKTHEKNFNEWKGFLSSLGYYNVVYKLNAKDFGIPQKRERVYMLSVLVGNDALKLMELKRYLDEHKLENINEINRLKRREISLREILKINYEENPLYREEANYSQPNDTPSRQRIFEKNDVLYDGVNIKDIIVNTVTTKQDRHPNSGVIVYDSGRSGKAVYRNLTPRECFLLMGFDEEDFQILIENNIDVNKRRKLFTKEKLIKMAGNSIVVDVLEVIFRQIREIEEIL